MSYRQSNDRTPNDRRTAGRAHGSRRAAPLAGAGFNPPVLRRAPRHKGGSTARHEPTRPRNLCYLWSSHRACRIISARKAPRRGGFETRPYERTRCTRAKVRKTSATMVPLTPGHSFSAGKSAVARYHNRQRPHDQIVWEISSTDFVRPKSKFTLIIELQLPSPHWLDAGLCNPQSFVKRAGGRDRMRLHASSPALGRTCLRSQSVREQVQGLPEAAYEFTEPFRRPG